MSLDVRTTASSPLHLPRKRGTEKTVLSRFLHDGDRLPKDGVDIEIGRVEDVRIRGRPERRNDAFRIALVATPDVGEDHALIGVLALAPHLDGAALRAHLGRGGDENLYIGMRADDRSDVPPVQYGTGRHGSKILLESQQRGPHLRDR